MLALAALFACATTPTTVEFLFDGDTSPGWTTGSDTTFPFTRSSDVTPSANTGPSSGVGGSGHYYFAETSSPRVAHDIYSLSYDGSACACGYISTISFSYHMYGTSTGTLTLDTGDAHGSRWSLSGNQGNAWLSATVGLWAASFRFTYEHGGGYLGDAALARVIVDCCGPMPPFTPPAPPSPPPAPPAPPHPPPVPPMLPLPPSQPPVAPAVLFASSVSELEAALGTPDHDVELAAGIYMLSSALVIQRSLTLRAAVPGSVALDGGDAVRVLIIQAVQGAIFVTLDGLNITRGNCLPESSTCAGGGIVAGAPGGLVSVTLSRCSVHANRAYLGGGIYSSYVGGPRQDSSLTITGASVIRNNIADTHGGGMRVRGPLTISGGASVIYNQAGIGLQGSNDGGGAAVKYGPVTILDATIAHNSAEGDGGGIYAELDVEYSLTITSSVLRDNVAGASGGGLSAQDDSGAPHVFLTGGSLFRRNHALDGGGARVSGTTLAISNCTFDANTAGRLGSALYTNPRSGSLVDGFDFRDHPLNTSTVQVTAPLSWYCPLGTYMNATGAFTVNFASGTCLDVCWAGFFGDSHTHSTSSCAGPCWPGHYCPKRSVQPTPCPVGTFQPFIRAQSIESCLACPPGTASNVTANNASCPKCLPGAYAERKGASQCDACPAGGFCGVDAAESLFQAFTPCSPGSFNSLRGASSSDSCTLCPAGTMNPSYGSEVASACVVCGPGSFSSQPGSQQCTACPKGTYAAQPGSTACSECAPGHWCTAAEQVPCGEDKYNPLYGSHDIHDCLMCPQGVSTTNGNETTVSGSGCLCLTTYYDASRSSVDGNETDNSVPDCRPCSVGAVCNHVGITLAKLPIHVGFWRPSAHSTDVRRCPDAAQGCQSSGQPMCLESRSGCRSSSSNDTRVYNESGRQLQSANVALVDSLCAPTLTGAYCRACVDESSTYYVAATHDQVARCEDCAAESSGIFEPIINGFLILLAVLFGVAVLRAIYQYILTPSSRQLMWRLYHATKPANKLKIVIGFYQIVVQIDNVYDVELPSEVRAVLHSISVSLSFGMASVNSILSCMGYPGYHNKLIAYMIIPALCVVVIFLGSILRLQCGGRVSCKAVIETAFPLMTRFLFLMYPIMTNIAFEAFSCYEFDNGDYAVLVSDVTVECSPPWGGRVYHEEHQRIVTTAVLAIAIYPLGLMAALALALFVSRKAIRTGKSGTHTAISRSIKFLYREYEPQFYWWELLEMFRRVVLVGVMLLIYRGSVVQIIIGTVLVLVYLFVQMQAVPYAEPSDDFLANACSFSVAVAYLCAFCFKIGALVEPLELSNMLSEEQKADYHVPYTMFSLLLLLTVFGALATAFVILLVQFAAERARIARDATMRKLPRCDWEAKKGQRYTCFLSHYKVEAGAEARYLKDSLDAMLGFPAYLDSSNLADLRELFHAGVKTSEVLVLLLTEGLLTRPWCLLEIRQAMNMGKPIVLLDIKGRHFSFDKAYEMLSDIETYMPDLNPYCLDELRTHLGDETLIDLQETVKAALELGRSGDFVPELNLNGTSNALEAQLIDLCESLASATQRTLEWTGGAAGHAAHVHNKPTVQSLASWTQQVVTTVAAPLAVNRSSTEKEVHILYHPAAKEHAKRLQEGMRTTLLQACTIDTPVSDEDLLLGLERIVDAKYVLLLQSKDVLSQPWPLLAMFTACQRHVPIVCVAVSGAGYDFAAAKSYLDNLSTNLDPATHRAVASVLVPATEDSPNDIETEGEDSEKTRSRRRQRSIASRDQQKRRVKEKMREMQNTLAALVPSIISVVYNPSGSSNDLAATVRDIRDKQAMIENTIDEKVRISQRLSKTNSKGSRRSLSSMQSFGSKKRLSSVQSFVEGSLSGRQSMRQKTRTRLTMLPEAEVDDAADSEAEAADAADTATVASSTAKMRVAAVDATTTAAVTEPSHTDVVSERPKSTLEKPAAEPEAWKPGRLNEGVQQRLQSAMRQGSRAKSVTVRAGEDDVV